MELDTDSTLPATCVRLPVPTSQVQLALDPTQSDTAGRVCAKVQPSVAASQLRRPGSGVHLRRTVLVHLLADRSKVNRWAPSQSCSAPCIWCPPRSGVPLHASQPTRSTSTCASCQQVDRVLCHSHICTPFQAWQAGLVTQ